MVKPAHDESELLERAVDWSRRSNSVRDLGQLVSAGEPHAGYSQFDGDIPMLRLVTQALLCRLCDLLWSL